MLQHDFGDSEVDRLRKSEVKVVVFEQSYKMNVVEEKEQYLLSNRRKVEVKAPENIS